jgi:hypothetical protein
MTGPSLPLTSARSIGCLKPLYPNFPISRHTKHETLGTSTKFPLPEWATTSPSRVPHRLRDARTHLPATACTGMSAY